MLLCIPDSSLSDSVLVLYPMKTPWQLDHPLSSLFSPNLLSDLGQHILGSVDKENRTFKFVHGPEHSLSSHTYDAGQGLESATDCRWLGFS